jgi:hypothetical protein
MHGIVQGHIHLHLGLTTLYITAHVSVHNKWSFVNLGHSTPCLKFQAGSCLTPAVKYNHVYHALAKAAGGP